MKPVNALPAGAVASVRASTKNQLATPPQDDEIRVGNPSGIVSVGAEVRNRHAVPSTCADMSSVPLATRNGLEPFYYVQRQAFFCGIALVVMIIYLFLRSLRATIIPGVVVPLSLIGTFGVMYLLGYSLDNLSLMALTISTGFVVDDAIVMIENISRYIEAGEQPFAAALKGARQIGFTIVSLTVSLVAVLIPLLFMGGSIGRLFREFAITLSIAIFVSALLSLTLARAAHALPSETFAARANRLAGDLDALRAH